MTAKHDKVIESNSAAGLLKTDLFTQVCASGDLLLYKSAVAVEDIGVCLSDKETNVTTRSSPIK